MRCAPRSSSSRSTARPHTRHGGAGGCAAAEGGLAIASRTRASPAAPGRHAGRMERATRCSSRRASVRRSAVNSAQSTSHRRLSVSCQSAAMTLRRSVLASHAVAGGCDALPPARLSSRLLRVRRLPLVARSRGAAQPQAQRSVRPALELSPEGGVTLAVTDAALWVIACAGGRLERYSGFCAATRVFMRCWRCRSQRTDAAVLQTEPRRVALLGREPVQYCQRRR